MNSLENYKKFRLANGNIALISGFTLPGGKKVFIFYPIILEKLEIKIITNKEAYNTIEFILNTKGEMLDYIPPELEQFITEYRLPLKL